MFTQQVSARLHRRAMVAFGAGTLALAGCGGGGGDSPAAVNTASAQFAQRCSPANPFADAGLKNGRLGIEKQWLRAYMDEAYLWYDQVPAVDANAAAYSGSDVYVALDNYFQALKTPQFTPSGARRDQFSFTYPTAEWQALSQSGITPGYGMELVLDSPTPPRNIHIAYIEPNTQAAALGLRRGDVLVSVDGVTADDGSSAGVAVLNATIFPPATAVGTPHNWVFSRAGTALAGLTMTVANVTKQPVLTRSVITATNGSKVGYLLFNDHLATAEAQLVEAFTYFNTQGVTDLVLDMRYNGGGYLYIASELAYMIAGAARTNGQVFEQLSFSTKRSADTNSADAHTPFYNTSTGGVGLPTLNLSRVYVLAQSDTCSASEAVINGLRGVGVDVRLIGGTTCGKPYGFTAKDNCGISYFPIEFKGVNAQGFGDYADGFAPSNFSSGANVAGCSAADDMGHALGDPAETMLATALGYRSSGNLSCQALVGRAQPQSVSRGTAPASTSHLLRGPARENRILVPRP